MAKIAQVKVGQCWTCKISGNITRVRVDAIRTDEPGLYKKRRTRLELTNIRTGRKVERSAAALRSLVTPAEES